MCEIDSYAVSIKDKPKAKVQVGKDVVDAEYSIFEHQISKKKMTFKDKLEDLWDIITIPYWRIRYWVREICWKIHYGFQRMLKGYDNIDTFEMFAKFIERYEKILKDYRKNLTGHPADKTEEEWNDIIDEMIYHLHYMDEDNVIRELKKDVPEEWSPSLETLSNIMCKHKDEFFKLFSEHFYSLWD